MANEKMELFKTPNITIELKEELQLLIVRWQRISPSSDYREAWEKALQFAKEYHTCRWLIDQREAGAISPKDLAWATEEWYPRALATLGEIHKTAIIPSRSAFGEMNTRKAAQKMESRFPSPLLLAYFQEEEEALQWLCEEQA